MKAVCTLLLLFLLGLTAAASAHDARPVYVDLHEMESGKFSLQWKVPTSVPRFALPTVLLPEGCEGIADKVMVEYGDAFVTRQNVSCSGPIFGKQIGIRYPLHNPSLSTLYRLNFITGESITRVLSPEQNSLLIPEEQTSAVVAKDYTILGIEHILFGFDHILFVFSLLLLVRSTSLLIKTITAFTIAHSITLVMASYGVVKVPAAPVEAVIALSIVFVACELVQQHRGIDSLAQRSPWLVAFSFGLLHGFGFAGTLAEVGLPQGEIPLALLFFNVGVELGQLGFVAVTLILFALIGILKITWPRWSLQLPAYGIGTLAAFWGIQRFIGIF